MERMKMNTLSLQKNFKEVYNNLFIENSIVLSGTYMFPWGPIWGKHLSHYIRVKSKIPLKCYVWLAKNDSGKVIFKSAKCYDIVKKEFVNYEINTILKEEKKILGILNKFLKDHWIKEWLDISILSEISRGHSFGFSWTMFAVLSTWLYECFNLMETLYWNSYEGFMKSREKYEIYNLALSLESVCRYGNTIWQNIIGALDNYCEPTILVTGEFKKDTKSWIINKVQMKHIPIMSNISRSITNDIPFDYAMIYSGIEWNTKQVEQFKQADGNLLDDYRDLFRDIIEQEKLIAKDIYLNKILVNEGWLYNHIADTIWILNLKTIDMFRKIAQQGYKENLVDKFIYNINQYRYATALLEEQSSFAEDLNYFFRKNRVHSDELIWIMPTASSKIGWGYVIVTKPGMSRITIEKTIENLKEIYPNVASEYCSYLDGNSNDGIIIEQHIKKWIFSKYINRNLLIYTDNHWKNYLWDYLKILNTEDGLVLDKVNNKIYFNGTKLTSKDIHSQNTTITILIKLLENGWKELSNRELGSSSYAKNKNDMIGKIVGPLVKYIEKQTGEKLSITCKWSITDFYLKMENIDFKIGIIDKIHI